jgi:hypothetical protein
MLLFANLWIKKQKPKMKCEKISMYSHKLTKESVLPTISARFPVSGGGLPRIINV